MTSSPAEFECRRPTPPPLPVVAQKHSLEPVMHSRPAEFPTPAPSDRGSAWPAGAATLCAGLAVGLALGFGLFSANAASTTQPEAQTVINGRVGYRVTEDGKPHQWMDPKIVVGIDKSLERIDKGAGLAVQLAFGAWLATDAKLPDLSFNEIKHTEAGLEPDGVNSIVYAPIRVPGHEGDLAITIGFSDPETGRIVEADIVINEHHHFFLDPSQEARPGNSCDGSIEGRECRKRYDLQNVLSHEVGHFYGLGEDYDDSRSTMFNCTSTCELHKRDLTSDDVQAIEALYTGRLVSAPMCALSPTSRGDSNGSLLWVTLVAGATTLLRRRRARLEPSPSADDQSA